MLLILIAFLACLNATYVFLRHRHYRFFEQPIDQAPATPSARRVRVDDSPSPLSPFLRHFFSHEPNGQEEVWQVSVWAPKAYSLSIFTLFSPGHVLIYYLLLPASSITVLLAAVIGTVLSLELSFLQRFLARQALDTRLIHSQVMSEYDTKFVHPSLNRLMRNVGTQTRGSTPHKRSFEVDVYTPTVIINRGFTTHPNPKYVDQSTVDDQITRRESMTRTPPIRGQPSRRPSRMSHTDV